MFWSNCIYVENLEEILYYVTFLPNESDVEGSICSLHRIQSTYDLSPHMISKGIVLGKQDSYRLDSHECLEIGMAYLNYSDNLTDALPWFEEFFNILKHEAPEDIRQVNDTFYDFISNGARTRAAFIDFIKTQQIICIFGCLE